MCLVISLLALPLELTIDNKNIIIIIIVIIIVIIMDMISMINMGNCNHHTWRVVAVAG